MESTKSISHYNKQYYEANKEQRLSHSRAYREKNRDILNQKYREKYALKRISQGFPAPIPVEVCNQIKPPEPKFKIERQNLFIVSFE